MPSVAMVDQSNKKVKDVDLPEFSPGKRDLI